MAWSPGKPATLAVGIVSIVLGLLAGLLITIGQLISAFKSVAFAQASARSDLLSEGIETAIVHGLVCGGGLALVGVVLVVYAMRTPAS